MASYKIEVPETFLLVIAVYGNMGEGELPDLMRTWAQKKCLELGLEQQLRDLQADRTAELGRRLRNTLGDQAVNRLNEVIAETVGKLKGG